MAKNPTKSLQTDERSISDETAAPPYETNFDSETPETPPPVLYTDTAATDTHDYVRAANGVHLRVKKRIAMPSLQFTENMTIVVRIMDMIRRGEQVVETAKGKPKMEPGYCCTIGSLTGDQRILWTSSVLHGELERAYPDGSYVGRWFHITRLPMKVSRDTGMRYSPYVINEIEPPSAEQMAMVADEIQAKAIAAPLQAVPAAA